MTRECQLLPRFPASPLPRFPAFLWSPTDAPIPQSLPPRLKFTNCTRVDSIQPSLAFQGQERSQEPPETAQQIAVQFLDSPALERHAACHFRPVKSLVFPRTGQQSFSLLS